MDCWRLGLNKNNPCIHYSGSRRLCTSGWTVLTDLPHDLTHFAAAKGSEGEWMGGNRGLGKGTNPLNTKVDNMCVEAS